MVHLLSKNYAKNGHFVHPPLNATSGTKFGLKIQNFNMVQNLYAGFVL